MGMTRTALETYDGKTARDRLVEAEKVLDRLNSGAKISEVMEEFGISRATIYRRYQAALDARLAPTVDEYREAQSAHLDDLTARWGRQRDAAEAMIDAGVQGKDMGLVDRGMARHAEALVGLQRVAERRAKLMGLDAPVRVDARVTVSTPVDDAVAALVAEVEEVAR